MNNLSSISITINSNIPLQWGIVQLIKCKLSLKWLVHTSKSIILKSSSGWSSADLKLLVRLLSQLYFTQPY